ncbi:hypothetical protein JTE90_023127 [Oedothorax gibbosus]|uniref:Gustatory receptor n=1 Tax=Oedothorax gibbosus TaxID=931172 RepID=A0AAV6UMB2_9ARAC|nr:hypothetical protein JTE90_023127 [Oedothorax gibbosus]
MRPVKQLPGQPVVRDVRYQLNILRLLAAKDQNNRNGYFFLLRKRVVYTDFLLGFTVYIYSSVFFLGTLENALTLAQVLERKYIKYQSYFLLG